MTPEELKELSPEQIVAAYAALEQENAELAEGKGAAEKLVKTYEQQTVETKEASRKAANEGWVASMSEGAEAKMLPAERSLVTYILDALTLPEGTQVKAYTQKVTVKEGDKDVEKDVELSPADVLKKLYELRDKAVVAQLFTETSASTSTASSGEPALLTTAEEGRDVAVARAKEYAKKHKTPFEKAYRAVLDEDPDLKALVAGVRPEGQAAEAQGAAKFAQMVASK
jgi:hypothetical protein